MKKETLNTAWKGKNNPAKGYCPLGIITKEFLDPKVESQDDPYEWWKTIEKNDQNS